MTTGYYCTIFPFCGGGEKTRPCEQSNWDTWMVLDPGQGHTPVSKHRHAMHARVIFSRVGGLLETL